MVVTIVSIEFFVEESVFHHPPRTFSTRNSNLSSDLRSISITRRSVILTLPKITEDITPKRWFRRITELLLFRHRMNKTGYNFGLGRVSELISISSKAGL